MSPSAISLFSEYSNGDSASSIHQSTKAGQANAGALIFSCLLGQRLLNDFRFESLFSTGLTLQAAWLASLVTLRLFSPF